MKITKEMKIAKRVKIAKGVEIVKEVKRSDSLLCLTVAMFFLDEIIYGRPFSSTFFRGGAEHPLCQPVQCSYRNFNPCIIVIVIVIITCTCCTYNSNASNTGFVHACSPVVLLPIKVPSSSRPQRFCVSISSALAHCDSSSTPSLSFR